MEIISSGKSDHRAYHNGSTKTRQTYNAQQNQRLHAARRIFEESRPFIAWDGEGINVRGYGKPQFYVLFGNSATAPISNVFGLSTFECLDYIIDTGLRHPDAIHVGFAFGYDSNMIVQSLAPVTLMRLHRRGFVRLRRNGVEYIVTYRKSKFFQVTRIVLGVRTSVRIYDIFTFFMVSFETAYTDMIGPVPSIITQGKAGRKTFTLAEFKTVKEYWTLEIQLVRELAEELRRRVYGAGLHITEWHGPGALATHAMKQHGVKGHMATPPVPVGLASRYAYAAGRFELYHVGRIEGPVYGIDENSAYPAALRLVPSLSEGQWSHEDWSVKTPGQLIRSFGLYYVKLRGKIPIGVKNPSPLYHRDKNHELTFPWDTEGWYWGPEAKQAVMAGGRITEAWQYTGWTTRPFAFIDGMFDQRRKWKAEGNSAQMALKLAMNAMPGKAAQRVGYKENGRIPGWHQLEWAGFVTSYTRAMLFSIMRRIPFSQLIAVETDGFYTTMDPASLGIVASPDLGGWSVDKYDEVMYVQSGLAWLRKGECPPHCDHLDRKTCAWETKRRGLDPDSFTLSHCQDYLSTLTADGGQWPVFKGSTTRFATMGLALASRNAKAKHCVWTTSTREISVGRQGKRIHVAAFCDACKMGVDAFTKAHDLIICPPNSRTGGLRSYPHSIPWQDEEGHAVYRDRMEEADVYAY
jgi:hypothetical protein